MPLEKLKRRRKGMGREGREERKGVA